MKEHVNKYKSYCMGIIVRPLLYDNNLSSTNCYLNINKLSTGIKGSCLPFCRMADAALFYKNYEMFIN